MIGSAKLYEERGKPRGAGNWFLCLMICTHPKTLAHKSIAFRVARTVRNWAECEDCYNNNDYYRDDGTRRAIRLRWSGGPEDGETVDASDRKLCKSMRSIRTAYSASLQ
jgi:hypothetical protein